MSSKFHTFLVFFWHLNSESLFSRLKSNDHCDKCWAVYNSISVDPMTSTIFVFLFVSVLLFAFVSVLIYVFVFFFFCIFYFCINICIVCFVYIYMSICILISIDIVLIILWVDPRTSKARPVCSSRLICSPLLCSIHIGASIDKISHRSLHW